MDERRELCKKNNLSGFLSTRKVLDEKIEKIELRDER
jgi:hypothetical protein